MKQLIRVMTVALPLAALAIMAAVQGCDGDSTTFAPTGPAGPPADAIALLLTGTTDGNLEPCNCPGQPRGGLSRRQTLIGQLAPNLPPHVLLDAGDMLALHPDPIEDRFILSGYALLRYDAVAVGDQEIDRGVGDFTQQANAQRLPLVATNITDAAGRAIAPPFRRVTVAGRTVLVLAVLDPAIMQLAEAHVQRQVKVAEPAAAVAAALARARREGPADLVVLLAHLDPTSREELAAMARGVDLVVLSTEMDRQGEVMDLGEAKAVWAPARGLHVGVVEIEFPAASDPGRPRVLRAVHHPVEQTLARDPKLWENYQSYTFDAQQRNLRLLDKLNPGLDYVANASCKGCHEPQYAAWAKHKHGHAWQTIVDEGRSRDPACMRCHTTGFGFANGFTTLDRTPGLTNVGCQSCHVVDGGKHMADPKNHRPPPVQTDVCKSCHTEATSPDFDVKTYLPHATCPADGH